MAQEILIWDGLDLNDEVNFAIEDFTFKPAQKQPQWIENSDADGSILANEPQYTNAEFTFNVRIVPRIDMDAALAAHGQLAAKAQKASLMRDLGGIPLDWGPAGASTSHAWYVLLGELPDLPVTPSGDLAGWFVNAPLIPMHLVCRPFGYGSKVQIVAPVISSEPVQTATISGFGGDVPGEGRATLTDTASQDRRWLEWGLDQDFNSLLTTADKLTISGFGGALKTRSGAYSPSTDVVRATAVSSPVTMFSLGSTLNVGSFRVRARVYVTSPDAQLRVSYRCGDGPLQSLPFVAPPVQNAWCEIDLGEVSLDALFFGSQRSEIRVDPRSVGANTPVDVDYVRLVPTTLGYGKARGLQSGQATNLLAWDEFDQSAGSLDTPKALPLGGNWSEANKTGANGFQIDATNHKAQRTVVSDADANSGCYALAGTTTYTDVQVKVDVSASADAKILKENIYRQGVIARYVDVNNWVMAVVSSNFSNDISALIVYKRVGGTVSVIPTAPTAVATDAHNGILTTVILSINANGSFQAWAYQAGESPQPAPLITGQDADLATGGVLASGKAGMYDAWVSASSNTRVFDSFNVLAAPAAGRVCYSGKSVQVDSDDCLRQDSTGIYYGPPSTYRGARLFIPPAGDDDLDSRLAIKMHRNDIDLESNANPTDGQQLEVWGTPRVLTPRDGGASAPGAIGNFVDAALSIDTACGLLYGPEKGAAVATDLSPYARGAGALQNGASLITPGLVDGGAALFLDKSKLQYIGTGWVMRTNLCPNPDFEAGVGGGWGSNYGSPSAVSFTQDSSWSSDGSFSARFKGTSAANKTFGCSITVSAIAPGDSISVAAVGNLLTALSGAGLRLGLDWRDSSNAQISVSYSAGIQTPGVAAKSLTAVAPAGTDHVVLTITANVANLGESVDFMFDSVLIEKAAAVGSYFPTVAQLASGEAGWSGVAHASASDIGPFARGTARTFIGMLSPADFASFYGVFGPLGSGGHSPGVLIDTAGKVRFRLGDGAAHTDYILGPLGSADKHFIAIAWDDVAKTAQLSVDGVATAPVTGLVQAWTPPLQASRLGSCNGAYFPGSLLPFAVFLGALTPTEINELYLASERR